ncbi:VCBS repeat-containing protein [Oleiharenicola lentus]|uniref:VCBS repeat-containing protein n=1 Tax=Oleiharenicola lentus TaxID=2508720 RepID=A0A4Q1C523_9BACT|nr:VCBS repeat-containing protein [Oleiharenicola lentus]RXK53538.1 VCBS repeat-containing protein [Oleiharenicola lentus]
MNTFSLGRASRHPVRYAGIVAGLIAGIGLALSGCQPRTPAPATANRAAPKTNFPALVYQPVAIGSPAGPEDRPMVTNLQIADLDQDGLPDVIYSEARGNTVRWIRQAPRGVFTEQVIARDLPAPANVWAADVQGSGRLDVLVACMGQIMPNNDRIGSIVVLENLDNRTFQPRTLLEKTARVTDVRAANLTGHTDGKLDLVVGQFGYAQGETRWMKNLGGWRFESQIVNRQSGTVHTPVADFDGDSRPDFAALVTQEWEEVHLFRNPGDGGEFKDTLVWGSTNEDYGGSGLAVADVNRDGRPDLISTNGDGFDYAVRGHRPWHGIQWLENTGQGNFRYHRVGDFPGAYAPCAADLNGDGHTDLVAVSGFADWDDPQSVALMAWLNDGRQNFTPMPLARSPIKLVTAAVGDLDGDGVPEIVTGALHAFPPFERLSNITLWRRQ